MAVPAPSRRRLVLIVGTAMLLDMLFFAIVVPLLPTFADEYGLSKLGAGVLTGSYAAGVLAGALPGALLAVRYGPRNVMLVGLVLLAATSAGFAFGDRIELLDASRFLQGVGGAWTWGGAMTWMLMVAPPDQRGKMIGGALAIGVSGTVLGPVLGAVAEETSRALVFSGIVLCALALAALCSRLDGPPGGGPALGGLGQVVRSGAVGRAVCVLILPAVAVGAINVLSPLRLDSLGASALLVGATFTAAAICQVFANLLVGRAVDRQGYLAVLRRGLAIGAAVALLAALPSSLWLAALATVAAIVSFGPLNVPSIALLNETVEAAGASPALAFASVNAAWAIGQVIGSTGAGAIAGLSTDAVVLGLIAGLALLVRRLALDRRNRGASVATLRDT